MSPQEPESLTCLFQLRVEIPHECYERACTAICFKDRSSVRAFKWILGTVAHCTGKIAPVKVKKICHGEITIRQRKHDPFWKILAHLPDSQDNMPLQKKLGTLWISTWPWLRASKTSYLEDWWDRELIDLVMELHSFVNFIDFKVD